MSHSATIRQPGRVHPLGMAAMFLVAGLLAATVPFMEHAYVYTLATVLLICAIGPACRDVYVGRFDYFEPVHFLGLLFFVFFGLGAVWTVSNPIDISIDRYIASYVPQALLYCLLGFIALLMGYYGPWFGPKKVPRFTEHVHGPLFLLIPGLLGLMGYLALAAWMLASDRGGHVPRLLGTLEQFSPLFQFAWALAWMMYFAGRSTRAQRIVLFGVFAPGVLLVLLLTISNKSLVLTLVGIPVVAYWYAKRRIPWAFWAFLITLLLITVFVLFPFYNTLRNTNARQSHGQRLAETYDTINEWDAEWYWKNSVVSFKRRLSLINSVAVVVRDCGRWVPYANGATLFGSFARFIPRVLWPDKPTLRLGREFGETFRYVHVLDEKTSISASAPGELYWNFDLPGILIGLGLWGVLIRFLYRRYGSTPGLDPVRRAIHIVVLVQLGFMTEGYLANGLVIMTRTLILLELLRWASRQYGLLEVRPGHSARVEPAKAA